MTGLRMQLEAQQAIQDLIAQDAPLEVTLTSICEMMDRLAPDLITTIMLVDPSNDTLSLKAASKQLAVSYREAMKKVPIGPYSGSCGRAAFYQQPIVTEDIREDSCWESYRELAIQHRLRACWSYPVMNREGRLLGTFAGYYSSAGRPSDIENSHLSRAACLAALAVERHQDRCALSENRQRFRSLLTHHPDAVFSLDLDGIFRTVNSAVTRITGWDEVAVLGAHYSAFVVPGDLARAEHHFAQVCRGHPQHFEIQAISSTDRPYYLAVTQLPIEIDGQVVGIYGIVKDVTSRKESETQLRLLQRSVESSTNGIVILDALTPGLPVVYANTPYLAMTGYTANDVLNKAYRCLEGPETDAEELAKLWTRLAAKEEAHVVLRHYRRDGSAFWNDMYVSPVPDETGNVTHFIAVHHDISELKANEAQLAHHATHDPLTGCANRKLLEERLAHDHDLILRHQGLLEVLFIDLDDFKPINDSLGHAVGDHLLKEAARRLQGLLMPGDTLARFGGDEFVIVLTSLDLAGRAGGIAEQILASLARPFEIKGQEVYVTASIGVATSQVDFGRSSELVQYADLAMYEAKKNGRNTVSWYSANVMEAVNDQVILRRELQEAMSNSDFGLHYQPIVRAHDSVVVGFEALLRWEHPTLGQIPPYKFIPLAEQTGQIIPLGQWVIARACWDIKQLNNRLGTQYFVSVNVSPLQFHRKDFIAQLQAALDEADLSSRLLDVELTEGVLVEANDEAVHILQALRDLGVGVSIDDFGTGYSSLSYLRKLPVSKVKLDREFLSDIQSCPRSAAIVESIITLAHCLDLSVVAEGVETDQQRRSLVTRGCDLCQGYLFAKAMAPHCLEAFLLECDGQAKGHA